MNSNENILSIERLSGSIAAAVPNLDLSTELPPDICNQIRAAFAEHRVLVVRNDGPVGPDEQHRLAAVFGEPQPLEVFQFLGKPKASITFAPQTKIVASLDTTAPSASAYQSRDDLANLGLAGDADGWHTDSSFTHWLPRAAVLRAETIPPRGGDTYFSDLCAAYDGLSPTMQRWLSELTSVHAVPDGYKESINISSYGPDAEARFDDEFPPREWPMVISHPETGKKAIFVNPLYTVHIVGLTRSESNTLLRFLFRHVSSPDYVYRHHWKPGDLVVWDEVTTLHRAPNDFGSHDRKVVRVTAGRAVPQLS